MMPSYRTASHGFSLIGALFWVLLIGGAVTLGLRLGPYYLQFWTVRAVMDDTPRKPDVAVIGLQANNQTLEKKLYNKEIRSVKNEKCNIE